MECNPINGINGTLVLAILLPNILLGKHARRDHSGVPRAVLLLENIGRYGCMLLMVLPLFVGEFGYGSVAAMVISLGLNLLLLILYWVFWLQYLRRKGQLEAVLLAVLPTSMFLCTGVALGHWALVGMAAVFGACHVCTVCRSKPSPIGTRVTVKMDRPLGTRHPKHPDILYTVNYGYVPGIMAPDGAEQDAYVLGVDRPLAEFTGQVTAIIHRRDDVEEKWVVAPKGVRLSADEIQKLTHFQEQFFDTYIEM